MFFDWILKWNCWIGKT